MLKKKRVVITGMGVVSPLGIGVEEHWTALKLGKSGVKKISLFDASNFPTDFAAEVDSALLKDYIELHDLHEIKGLSRHIQFGLIAAEMATKDAGLDLENSDCSGVGIYLGCGAGYHDLTKLAHYSICSEDKQNTGHVDIKRLFECIYLDISPLEYFYGYNPNILSYLIAKKYNLKGHSGTIVTACAAGSQAIGDAYRIIERGDAECMLAGGSDSMINHMGMAQFILLQALSTNKQDYHKASRPFDKKRDGFVMGEGSAILVLEELRHAINRDARIYGEIVGYGSSCDAYRITDSHMEARGAIQSLERAISDGGLGPNDIDYICAHGTSTQLNDKMETIAIKRVFKDRAYKIPISSMKSMFGHLIHASGPVELVGCVMAILEGIIPPTINYENPDSACDLDYIVNLARRTTVDIAVKNAFGFGGQNVCLVVKRFERDSLR